jgi:hypothetical protein
MSVHIWLDISCLSSVCQGCCTCNPEIICGLHVQQPWQTLERHKMSISGLHVQQPWQTLEIHEMSNLWVTCTTTLTDTWETHNTVKVFGGVCPGALSSPLEVNKSVITFLSLFVFVLVNYLSFLLHLLTYETLWFGTTLFFLVVIIHVQVCWQIAGEEQQNKSNMIFSVLARFWSVVL